jgi:GT2 family glycosyltransferase
VKDTVEPLDVAVVVPVGGAAPAWSRTAASLARLDPPPGQVVVVVDGRPTGPLIPVVGVANRVVALEDRGGPARARNRGAREASADILLFLDADVEAPGDLVSRVASIFAADPALAAVFGSYDADPADPGFLSQYRNLLHHFVHQHAREEATTFWAGCGAIRREVFDTFGGFDERYREPSIEDIELGSRLVRAGYAIRLAKDLQVKHLKRWSLGDMLATDLWRRAVPWTELMLRQREPINDLNVKSRDRLSVVLALVALITLAGAWSWPALLGVVAASLVLVVVVNAQLFRFFLHERGVLFALGTIPVYWVYLLTCGVGSGLGLLRFLRGPKRA